jgi:adenosylcobinamide-phosphate synthase
MVVLLVVVMLKILISKLSMSLTQQRFFSFFRFYCQQLAKKVNNENNSDTQRKVAGFIATLITIPPLVIIVWLFEAFIVVPILWQSILLFVSLGVFNLNRLGLEIANTLSAQDKYQTKQLISPWLCRDSYQLSPIGISKACIEMLLLRKLQQQFTVGFFFIFIGPLAALTFRLLLETHYSWNIKQHKFHTFGQFINHTINILQWLPGRVFLLLLIFTSINKSTVLFLRLIKKQFFKANNSIILNYLSYLLGVKLGGVAMYNKKKVQRSSFNEQGQQPQPKDIITTIKQLNLMMALALGILISITTIIAILVSNT